MASQTRGKGRKGSEIQPPGTEGKAAAKTRGRSVAETGLAAARRLGGGGGTQGGLLRNQSGPGRAAPRHGSRPPGAAEEASGAAEEAAGLGVGRWGGAPMRRGERPGGPGTGLAGGRPAGRRRARQDCACPRGPRGSRAEEARGKGTAGWGGGREVGASHNNKPQPFPTPASPAARFPLLEMHSLRHRVRAEPQRLRRRRVARLSLAQSGRPHSGASSSGPSTRLQRPHFRFPCHSGKWLPEVPPHPARPSLASARFPFLRALGAIPQVSCGALRVSALFSILPLFCM